MTIIWFILAGLAGGVLGGLGMGGGTLLIPILTLLLGVEQKLAQTINLVVFLPMATVAIIVNIKRHMIRFDKILFLLLPALVTSVGSAFLAQKIAQENLKKYFGIFLIVIGGIFLILSLIQVVKKEVRKGKNHLL